MSTVTTVPASPQEYLDLLVAKSAAGELPAVDAWDAIRLCRYRSRKGLACPAGLLVPDADYDPGLEGLPAETLFTDHPRLCPPWATPAQLAEVQHAHDDFVLGPRGAQPWSHAVWVSQLLACDLFRGLGPAHYSGVAP